MKIVDGKVVAETEEEQAALGATVEADVSGLKTKNAELLAKIKEQKKSDAIDHDEYQTLKQQAAEAEANRLKKSGEFDTLKGQLVTAHQKEIEARNQREVTMKAALEQHLIDSEATRSITDAKGSSRLLLPHVKSMVRVEEDGGRYVTRVVDPLTGSPRVKADGSYMSIAELVAEMKADVTVFGRAFEPSGSSGSGSQQSSGAGGQKTMPLPQFNELSPVAKSQYMAGGGTLTD